jgi:hypothetical protein
MTGEIIDLCNKRELTNPSPLLPAYTGRQGGLDWFIYQVSLESYHIRRSERQYVS